MQNKPLTKVFGQAPLTKVFGQAPLISVVIPARNEEKYLGNCLEALSKQDYPNYEIVVIDNASSDKTSDIAKKFTPRVFREEKKGLSYARERGFNESRGEIIARTDADSQPPKNWLTRINEAFENDSSLVALSGRGEFFDQGEFWRRFSGAFFLNMFYFDRIIMGHYRLSGPNFALRKSALVGLKPHLDDSIVHEDVDLSCHIATKGKVGFLSSLVIPISGRRLKENPGSLLDYFKRYIITYFLHHPSHELHNIH